MNEIARIARVALTASGYPTKNNRCQQWARLVVQASPIGHKYDKWLWQETAREAGEELLKLPFGMTRAEAGKLQPGDVLYKLTGSGNSGHVGVYLGAQQVAENSTVHWNRSGGKDARGIRSLSEFGDYDVVVRFPLAASTPAKPADAIILSVEQPNGKWKNLRMPTKLETTPKGQVNFAPAQELLREAGVKFSVSTWGDGTPNVRIPKR